MFDRVLNAPLLMGFHFTFDMIKITQKNIEVEYVCFDQIAHALKDERRKSPYVI